jgi:endonuclease/exonuclease/phosphatase family metal-dependent hydrolase
VNYWKLKQLRKSKQLSAAELKRAVGSLERLRAQLSAAIPPKDAEDNLLLATWNIRDLGKAGGGYGYGDRLPESYFYIAEILSRFDFIAVQEVNELWAWGEVMDALGPHWGFIASDVTEGVSGNGERLVYLYDERKVSFRDVAGEIVLQPSTLISRNAKGGKQFARTPYIASFQAGWRKFDICSVHIYYGSESGAKLKRRIEEIGGIARLLAKRAKAENAAGKTMVLAGDFNVVGLKHKTMEALLESGFVVPEKIKEPPGGQRNNYYDQIAFKTAPDAILFPKGKEEEAGSLRIYEGAFTLEQIDSYGKYFKSLWEELNEKERKKAKEKGKEPKLTTFQQFYEDWRTWQLSDHQPLWVRLKANDSDEYLKSLLETG